MRVGIYGGSFDPIHQGHVLPVREASNELGLGRVIYLPTSKPPHKPGRKMVDSRRRFAMVEIALLEVGGLEASPFEMRQETPAYTVDTLRHFREELPGDELYLIMGSDSFENLEKWKNWREILTLAQIAVLTRLQGGLGKASDSAESEAERAPEILQAVEAGRVTFMANRPRPFSSSELRRRFMSGEEPPSGALAPQVLKYIEKYDLYR